MVIYEEYNLGQVLDNKDDNSVINTHCIVNNSCYTSISSTEMRMKRHVGTVHCQASPTSLLLSSRTGSRWREARFCSSSYSSDCYLDLFPIQYLSKYQQTRRRQCCLGVVHLHLPPARHPHVPHLHLRRDRPGRPTHWCSQPWDKLHWRQPWCKYEDVHGNIF